MLSKFEALGIFASVAFMALALFLLRVETNSELAALPTSESQTAAIAVVAEGEDANQELFNTLADSVNTDGAVEKLVIDDVIIGSGDAVEKGDKVDVHYIGRLMNGQEFDNSYSNRKPFTFKVGGWRVIEGWDLGVVGMKKGGQRILVIPPELAYGNRDVGPIPAGATLIFAIELIDINE